MTRWLKALALVAVMGFTLDAGEAGAHTAEVVKSSTCTRSWRTTSGMKSMMDCFAGHFDLDRARFVELGRCESGWRYNADENPPYVGVTQFDSTTWSGAKPHHLPNNLGAGRKQGRLMVIATARMIRHGEGWRWPSCW